MGLKCIKRKCSWNPRKFKSSHEVLFVPVLLLGSVMAEIP